MLTRSEPGDIDPAKEVAGANVSAPVVETKGA